jgi:hypothetical protein
MRINIKNGNKQKMFLQPETIVRYLIMDDDDTDTLILCKSSEVDLVTTDKDLYEALGSVKPYDDFKFNKLRKLFEVTEIMSFKEMEGKQKPILKEERVEEIRKLALKK